MKYTPEDYRQGTMNAMEHPGTTSTQKQLEALEPIMMQLGYRPWKLGEYVPVEITWKILASFQNIEKTLRAKLVPEYSEEVNSSLRDVEGRRSVPQQATS